MVQDSAIKAAKAAFDNAVAANDIIGAQTAAGNWRRLVEHYCADNLEDARDKRTKRESAKGGE